MDAKETIQTRRANGALEPMAITDEVIEELATATPAGAGEPIHHRCVR